MVFSFCVLKQKINQKNTWELNLIDHLCEIIKVEEDENNAETNFQKVKLSALGVPFSKKKQNNFF